MYNSCIRDCFALIQHSFTTYSTEALGRYIGALKPVSQVVTGFIHAIPATSQSERCKCSGCIIIVRLHLKTVHL